jgi:hypothetical protein
MSKLLTGVVAGLLVSAGPAYAQTAKSEMSVGVQPPPAPVTHPRPPRGPYYPYPLAPVPEKRKRCEQDRLLTDTTPCDKDGYEIPQSR